MANKSQRQILVLSLKGFVCDRSRWEIKGAIRTAEWSKYRSAIYGTNGILGTIGRGNIKLKTED